MDDPRLAEAVEVVRAARGRDGTWRQGRRQEGAVWLKVDVPEDQVPPRLTFLATRVLLWWGGA